MDFYAILDQILALLRQRQRVTYQALQRQFHLDEAALNDLKAELLYAYQHVREDPGRGLVWSGDAGHATAVEAPLPSLQNRTPLFYTPSYLAEKILHSRSALEGERKQITVLFTNIKGSMELVGGRDPEEAQQLLDPALHIMMAAVHRYEGTVNQVLGDGIMALFGAPLAHEDHAVRACYAALAMRTALQRYSEQVHRRYGMVVQARVGLNSGEVVVRTIGNDLHMDYSAIGEATHLAARMEQLATPGSILLTADTLRLVEGLVQLTARGALPVKGLPNPIEVFELVGAGPTRKRLQAAAARGLTPFVGRQTELEALRRALEQARTGSGQVVAVVGEPGVGKSRLFWEFTRADRMPGWLILESGSASYDKATAYLPVVDLLRAYFQIDVQDDGGQIREKLTGKLHMLDMALEPTLPALLALLGVPVENPQWEALDSSQRRQHTLDAVEHLLLLESQRQPLCLVFEGLHWIDAGTQTVLDSLMKSLPTARLLLLLNHRSEYQHGWKNLSTYTQLQIDPLPPESAEELLLALLGDNVELEPLKSLLIERTEGNPFFLEETVRTLVETHVLVGTPGAYRLAQAGPGMQVPATVQAILAARIDRLPPTEKRLLQLAAVIGKEVPFVLLQAIAELPEEVLCSGLVHLQTAGFLDETNLFPELEYAFKHTLTCEVAYGSLLESRRRVSRAAVGLALEDLYADRLEEVCELLAHHFGQSAEDEKAVDYTILAAEKAQRRWANSTALAHFEAALQRLAVMPDTVAHRRRRIDAVLKQAEVKFALGQHADHIKALEGIAALVQETDDPRRRATWYYWMGFLHSFTGSRPEVTIAYCREAVAVAEAGGFEELRAFAECCLLGGYNVAGDLREALAVGERALAFFEEHGNIWWACRTLWQLSTTAISMGEWERSLAYCCRALEHGRAVDDLRLKVVGLWRTGSTHILQGNPQTGLRLCEEALALSPTPYDAAMVKAVRGYGLVKAGETAHGTAELAEAVEWLGRSQLPYTRAVFALRLGDAYLRQGERVKARAIFEEVLVTSREGGYRYHEGRAGRLLGEVVAPEDPVAAAHLLEAAVRILEKVGARNELAQALVAQANLRQAAGDAAGARQLLERALALFEALGTLDEPSRVRAVLAALEPCPAS
jgi:class 3 adenylate cyclase/tetratricopeptide (TPR) repeat protein